MAQDTQDGRSGGVIRFSGDKEEKYPGWKVWANAHLRKKTSYDDMGLIDNEGFLAAELVTLLQPDSEAFNAIKHISEDEKYGIGGYRLIWAALDQRFPEKGAMNLKGESLDAIFKLKPTASEPTANYVGRTRNAFSSAKALKLEFDEDIKGYVLLRCTRLSDEQQAVVLSLAKGNWDLKSVSEALRATYPDKLPAPSQKNTFFLDSSQNDAVPFAYKELSVQPPVSTSRASAGYNVSYDDAPREVLANAQETEEGVENFLLEERIEQAVNLLWACADGPEGTYTEEEVVGCYVAWAAARKQLGAQKLARRFPKAVPSPAGLAGKVKCWNCDAVGHFSRDCKKPKRAPKGGRARQGREGLLPRG
jgi:hypothetical protein